MSNYKKILLTVVAMVLVCAISVMGTLAYLSAQTEAVTNTFVAAELNATLTLNESTAVADANDVGVYTLTAPPTMSNSYTLMPGVNVPKDPVATVDDLTVEAYLFLEVTDLIWPTSGLSWELDSGWTHLKTVSGWKSMNGDTFTTSKDIYYRVVNPSTDAQAFNIIKNEQMVVPGSYDPNAPAPAPATSSDPPLLRDAFDDTLEFKAYLCQTAGFASAEAAWDNFTASGW